MGFCTLQYAEQITWKKIFLNVVNRGWVVDFKNI